jgi:hypothetical protein
VIEFSYDKYQSFHEISKAPVGRPRDEITLAPFFNNWQIVRLVGG